MVKYMNEYFNDCNHFPISNISNNYGINLIIFIHLQTTCGIIMLWKTLIIV